MCTETGIKDVYRGVQGACPRRAVTHAGGTAERSERRAVGMGLKLVVCTSRNLHPSLLGPTDKRQTLSYFEPVQLVLRCVDQTLAPSRVFDPCASRFSLDLFLRLPPRARPHRAFSLLTYLALASAGPHSSFSSLLNIMACVNDDAASTEMWPGFFLRSEEHTSELQSQ